MRVLDEVGEHTAQGLGLRSHRALRRDLDLDRATRDVRVERGQAHQRAQVELLRGGTVRVLLHTRRREHFLDHCLEPPGLTVDDIEKFLPLARVVGPTRGRDGTPDGGDRRTQLVAHRGNELGFHPV